MEKVCPIMLSMDCANLIEKSPWKNLLKNSTKLKFCSWTYVLNVCSTIIGTKYTTGIVTIIVKPRRRISAEIFFPFTLFFITLCTGLKMYAKSSPNIIGMIIGLRTKNAKMNIPTMIAPTTIRFMSL